MSRAEVRASWSHSGNAHGQIVIGVHGDEMMQALWMQQTNRSAVIELWEEGGFVRESLASPRSAMTPC